MERSHAPVAVIFALWLRELGVDEQRIAEALDVETDAVERFLHTGARGESGPVAVIVDGPDIGRIEEAARRARDLQAPLYVIACDSPKPSEAWLIEATQRALLLDIDVRPVVAGVTRAVV